MVGHKRYQKLTAVLTLLGLVLALIPVAVLALPKAQAEPADPAHPIIGGEGDTWPLDPSREEESRDLKSAGSIALVFEFGSWYGYQTMGGAVPGTNRNTRCPGKYGDAIPDSRKRLQDGRCRNWDQNKAVAEVVEQLKGSPLSVGIYHYARKQDQGIWASNTPDLQATSLADKSGYQKVMNKIWSLDATDGNGGNIQSGFGGNSEWGLGKLYRDMYRYKQAQLAEHAGEPDFKPRPLYSKIVIMSMSDPHWHLSKSVSTSDSICRPNATEWKVVHDEEGRFVDDPENVDSDFLHHCLWSGLPLERNPGRAGMLDVARMIRGLGADIRTMGMGDWVDRFPNATGGGESTRHMFLRALTGVEDYKKATKNYQYIPFPSDSARTPNGHFSYPGGNYYRNPARDGIANGTFKASLSRWMWEDTHFSLTSDLVDGDFRYVKPNVGQKIHFKPLDGQPSQNHLTGKDGRTVISLTKAKMTGGVEVTFPRETAEYQHTNLKGKAVRCQALDRSSGGGSVVFEPEEIPYDPLNPKKPAGFKISKQQISDYFSIKCATYSRPLQKMTFQKEARVLNEQIRYEIGGYPNKGKYDRGDGAKFEYTWECTDPKAYDPDAVLASGTKKQEVHGLNVVAYLDPIDITANKALPVGTKCIIKETITLPQKYSYATANAIFTSKSDFKGTNFDLDKTEKGKDPEGKQSVSNKIVGRIKLHDPKTSTIENSLLESKTFYNSLRASIRVTLRFSNSKSDPALAERIRKQKLPHKVPLYYNCRFMPDPTKPPEIPDLNLGSYPGYVGATWVGVKTDGSAELVLGKDKNGNDTWPVGAHCLFSTNPPASEKAGEPDEVLGNSVNIPGVITKDTYNSNVCAEDAKTKLPASRAKNCRNNYFWVHSPGKNVINITEDLQRLQGKLRVTKKLSGEAAAQGIGQEFPMNLTCKDPDVNVTVPNHGQDAYSFFVKSTESKLVENVPAGLNCDLNEDALRAPRVVPLAQLTLPATVSTTITDTTIETPISIENKLSYKLADLTVNHRIAWGNPQPDSVKQNAIKSKDNKVTVSCQLPGESGQVTKELDISANGTENTSKSLSQQGEQLPVGSECTVQSLPQNIDGLGVKYTAPPQTVTIGDSGATANLTTTYSLPKAGEISVQGLMKSRPQYDALKIPDSLDATVECEKDGGNATSIPIKIDLKDGNSATVPSATIAEGATCKLKADLADLDGRIEWKWSNQDDLEHAANSPIDSQFTAPVGTNSANIVIRLWAKAKTNTVNFISNSSMWTSKNAAATAVNDRINVPEEWRKAVLGIAPNDADSAKVPLEVKCEYTNGTVKSEATFSPELANGGTPTSMELPANWDCTATTYESALKIPGTTLQAPAWKGANGTASADKYSYQWKTVGQQDITLNRDYRLQLASFNFKKKVGGEGVAIISGKKQFKMNWSCSLNGKSIPIPAPREIDVNADAQATFGADLKARLQDLKPTASTQMGRFQQGEWHVIDALPAGAICTVEEDQQDAQVDQTILHHYWEITPGYRSREPASMCEAASDKCRPANEGDTVKAQVLLPRDHPTRNNIYKAGYGNVDAKDAQGNRVNPIIPDTLPENFAGTMVPWNNYTFEKTQVRVSLKNTGNGAPLTKSKNFNARLYCAPPPLIGGDAADQEAAFEEAVAAQIINVALTFEETAPGSGEWKDAIGSQMIPVGYRCVLAEEKFPELDAQVTTEIAKEASQPTQTSGADGLSALFNYKKENKELKKKDTEKEILGFIVDPALVGVDTNRQQKQSVFTIENKLDRPAAKLKVAQVVRKNNAPSAMSVGQALIDKQELGYTVHYECTDKYLVDPDTKKLKVYDNSTEIKELPVDGEVTLLSGEGGGGSFVPATSTCKIWHENKSGKDPIANHPKVLLNPNAKIATGSATPVKVEEGRMLSPKELQVAWPMLELDSEGREETTVTFEDFYLVPFDQYQIGTAVKGDRRDEVLPESTTYKYDYTCTYPSDLPKPNAGYAPVTGSTREGERGSFVWLPPVPVGSVCEVTGTKPDTSAKPYLKVAGNWVPWNVDKLGTVLEDSTDFSKVTPKPALQVKDKDPDKGKFKITLGPKPKDPNQTGETESQTVKQGVVLYTVYSNGTKVRIYKARSPQGQVVTDATFSLYAVKAGGAAQNRSVDPGEKIDLVEVEGKPGVYESKTELAPGTYLMGNTNAGNNAGERFPFSWKFDIALDPANQDAAQDTKVTLSEDTGSSGLVAAYAPTDQVKAWQIELADVNFGSLPLTGGYLPWLWLVGISLVAASAAVMWHRRRE